MYQAWLEKFYFNAFCYLLQLSQSHHQTFIKNLLLKQNLEDVTAVLMDIILTWILLDTVKF